MNEFNEGVWDFGAIGTYSPFYRKSNDEQKEIISRAWAEAENGNDCDECDRIINGYYSDFCKAK